MLVFINIWFQPTPGAPSNQHQYNTGSIVNQPSEEGIDTASSNCCLEESQLLMIPSQASTSIHDVERGVVFTITAFT